MNKKKCITCGEYLIIDKTTKAPVGGITLCLLITNTSKHGEKQEMKEVQAPQQLYGQNADHKTFYGVICDECYKHPTTETNAKYTRDFS